MEDLTKPLSPIELAELTPLNVYALVRRLMFEVERLREGNFTPEEFQNLCHNSKPCTREEFEAGCKEYQEKLYGAQSSAASGGHWPVGQPGLHAEGPVPLLLTWPEAPPTPG